MDLTSMIPGGAGEEQAVEQRLSKEEYAAMKKQQREEVWAEVDAQAQTVFQNGESLKGLWKIYCVIAGNARFKGIPAGLGVGFTTDLLLLRERALGCCGPEDRV